MAEGPLLGLAREPVLRARELQALLLGWLLPSLLWVPRSTGTPSPGLLGNTEP